MIELSDPVAPVSVHRPEAPVSRWVRFVRFVLPPMAVAAVVIGMWLFVTYSLLREDQRPFLPPPQDVVSRGFLDWDRLQPILAGLGRTALVAVTGLAIAFVIGTAVADGDEPGHVAGADVLPLRRDPADGAVGRHRSARRAADWASPTPAGS